LFLIRFDFFAKTFGTILISCQDVAYIFSQHYDWWLNLFSTLIIAGTENADALNSALGALGAESVDETLSALVVELERLFLSRSVFSILERAVLQLDGSSVTLVEDLKVIIDLYAAQLGPSYDAVLDQITTLAFTGRIRETIQFIDNAIVNNVFSPFVAYEMRATPVAVLAERYRQS